MSAFPQYDTTLLAALDAQATKMLRVFAAKGYKRVEPPVLQPADVFLDRSGEEIRRRTFVFDDPTGRELCLRPELTIPVCRMALQTGTRLPARLAYHGPAFRFQTSDPDRPNQFFQTGVECLGLANRDTADKEVLALAIKAVRAAGLSDFSVKIGDLGLFAGLVDALDIPPQWRARLKRHFWRPGYFKALLARLSSEVTKNSDANAALEGLIAQIDAQDAVLGGRTREEIIERLTEQSAEAAAVRLNKRDVALIERVLGISGEASSALANLRNVLREVRVKLDAPLDTMERRLAALGKLGLGRSRVTFAANFGRNMEYYTGFVFELWSRDKEGDVQIAGGGRYDTLLRSLGSKIAHPAVGCAIRGERVLAARRKRGA